VNDETGLLLGDGTKMRHLKLTSVDDLARESLKRFSRMAVDLNLRFGDPTKGEASRAR
jgi:hypothetical protein